MVIKKMDFPKIEKEDGIYFQVGCKSCHEGNHWKIFINQKNKKIIAKCQCGQEVKLDEVTEFKRKPDQKPIDRRFF